jgi:lipopolysaccharide transport system permease protein
MANKKNDAALVEGGLSSSSGDSFTIIQANDGWQLIDFKELRQYQDLFYFLVWRDFKILYAQTILGFSWAIINPLIQIVLFSIIFGTVAQIPTDGIPYVLFSAVAIIPWTYMSTAMNQASQSLIVGQAMLGKIYFPRVLYPLTPILSRFVDFAVSLLILLGIMLYYQVPPTWNLLWLPMFLVLMVAIPSGIGLWLSSLAIRFRDVKQVMPFIIQMLMYTAPIVYSASSIPEKYRIVYSLNPIVGVIEGLRACLLGLPIPWMYVWPGMFTAMLLFLTGLIYFRRMERIVADVI